MFVPNRETDNTWIADVTLSLAPQPLAYTRAVNKIVLTHQNISALVCDNQRAVTKSMCSGRLTGLLQFVTNRLFLGRSSPVLHFFRYQRPFNADDW
jgi:thiamine transporter ThiT